MKRTLRLSVIAVVISLGILMQADQAVSIGGQFGLEFAIDAPWRLEPVTGAAGGAAYGPIPIVVAFHDSIFELARGRIAKYKLEQIIVGALKEIIVVEWTADQPHPRQPVTHIAPSELREIERKLRLSTKGNEPPHELCRPFMGQDCTALLDISRSHEWHAMFWYTPRAPVTRGRNIHLEVTVVTEVPAVGLRHWRNVLAVRAGDAPLPRFADNWLYGDFHYHSQMTDNEGESAYSYRNVVRALGALGMDFVFATDHASNGEQVDGYIEDMGVEARDLNQNRFAAAKSIIYGPDGANEAVARDAGTNGLARFRSAHLLPQIYMGEEVDAWPEMSSREQQDGVIYYGDGLRYPWPDANKCVQKDGLEKCRARYSQPYAERDHRTFLVMDEQGIPTEETVDDKLADHSTVASIAKFFVPDGTRVMPSRQHIVYMPTSSSLTPEGWIASDTGPFGGAGKRLQDVIQEIQRGGFAFLAHPLISSKPEGPGPDVVPYSDVALTRSWSSPAILGLQFWNENDRRYAAPSVRTPIVMATGSLDHGKYFHFNWPFQGETYGNFPWTWPKRSNTVLTELYQGAFTWDRFLRKGLNPSETQLLKWLPKGEPRKWFVAGGSDSHGDLNYRRYGRPCLDRWCDVPVGDTAIGKPRNLVFVTDAPAGPSIAALPAAKRYTNRQVIDAVRAGHFSVTDGPAIRIAVDKNRNGAVDDTDFQMGSTFNFFPGEHIPILVEWKSTPEFGAIAQIDLYIGTSAHTFAPKSHGPVIPPGQNRNSTYGTYQPDPSGVLQVKLVDEFGKYNGVGGSTGTQMHGRAKIFVGPAMFGLAAQDQSLFYVRAVAKTVLSRHASDLGQCEKPEMAGNSCGDRFAYSNPIWGRYHMNCPKPGAPDGRRPLGGREIRIPLSLLPSTSLDADENNVPDTCEKDIPDPCPPGIADRFRLRGDLVPLGPGEARPPVGPGGGGTPPAATPAKPIPRHSCQVVESLVHEPKPDVDVRPPGEVEGGRATPR